MKRESNIIQKFLFLVIAILAVILVAVMIRKGFTMHQDNLRQEELNVRNQEVQSEIDDIQMQIKELSGDGEALKKFLDEKINNTDNKENNISEQQEIPAKQPEKEVEEVMSESIITDVDADETDNMVSVTANEQETPIGPIVIPEKARPEVKEESVSVNDAIIINETEKPIFEPDLEPVSGNASEQEDTVSTNGIGGYAKEDSISGNAVVDGKVIPFQNINSSYVETMYINGEDRAQISRNNIDFSSVKIACLGDSITAGSNLNNLEDYEQYSYPSILKNILNIKEVYNLGIGGSSYGRYWDKAFVDRYKEIPEDSDIILVMGGTNDGFAASVDELGNSNERKPRTFYGDVDELMKGLKKDYPNAKVIFATPLPNVLQDYLMSQRDYLLPQSVYVNAIKELAAEHNIQVIDLYNSNLLNTHDAQVISTYMPDGVHGNPAGYQILAEHFASEIIKNVEEEGLYQGTVSGNSSFDNSVSGNEAMDDSISGNSVIDNSVSNNAIVGNENTSNKAKKEEILTEEEKQLIEENNKKIADDAMIITPKPVEKPQENKNNSSSGIKEPEPEEPQINYEYQGEAIVIQ